MSTIKKFISSTLLIYFFVLFFSISKVYSQQEKYDFEKENISLDADIYYYIDESRLLNFEDISVNSFSSQFIKSEKERFNLGKSSASIWLKIEVENKTYSHITDWFLELGYPTLDSVEFYYQNEEAIFEKKLTGDFFKFKQRPLLDINYIFPVKFKKNQKQVFYFKVSSQGTLVFPIQVVSHGEYIKELQYQTILFGMFYGVMFIILIYNLVIYSASRDRSYITYVIALIGHLFFIAAKNGHSYQFIFGESPYLGNLFLEIGIVIWLITDVLFTKSFIEAKKYAPKLDKFLSFLVVVGIVISLSIFIIDYRTMMKISTLISLIITVTLLFSGIFVWKRGNTSARFFVFAWGFYGLGLIAYTLNTAGLIPDTNLTFYAIEVGTILEIVLLSFALGDKFQIARVKNAKTQEKKNKELEQKVVERTNKINLQKEELETIAENLAHKNHNIMSSINYAKRIQDVMLPQLSDIEKYLPDSFVFYRPKDVVSGDFYWFYAKNNQIIIAAADCTGHGVSGAFLSLVASNLIHNIIIHRGIRQPDKILDLLHISILYYLKQQDNQNQDGLDIALCHIDKNSRTLSFSGAKNPLVYIENGEMKVIKGTRRSIGGCNRQNRTTQFENHVIKLTEEPTNFYIYSDGFQDQFGGKEDKKFRTVPFRELLKETSKLPIKQQEKFLSKSFEDWKGKEKQIDDVLVIGFKV